MTGPLYIVAWTAIELSVSTIIACCASFRALIVNNARAVNERSSYSPYRFINSFNARKKRAASDNSGFSHLQSVDGGPILHNESADISLPEHAH